MKTLVLTFLLPIAIGIVIPFSLFAQQDSGFTNKAEAKNLMVNGLKEGRWIEYSDASNHYTQDTNSPYYTLSTYKAGNLYGIVREYYKSGNICIETPYVNGKKNGIERGYYKNG